MKNAEWLAEPIYKTNMFLMSIYFVIYQLIWTLYFGGVNCSSLSVSDDKSEK